MELSSGKISEKIIEQTKTPIEKHWSFLEDAVDSELLDKGRLEIKLNEMWDALLIESNEQTRVNDAKESEYLSTYEERIKQTPREGERGRWESERGESKYIPYDLEILEILKKYSIDGINYKDGIPDFSKISESTVEIDNMTGNRYTPPDSNFEQCDEKCAKQWNNERYDGKTDWTARDVADWRRENGYSWHERNDMKTCDLVPTKINAYFGHLGGVGECKKSDSTKEGGFDD